MQGPFLRVFTVLLIVHRGFFCTNVYCQKLCYNILLDVGVFWPPLLPLVLGLGDWGRGDAFGECAGVGLVPLVRVQMGAEGAGGPYPALEPVRPEVVSGVVECSPCRSLTEGVQSGPSTARWPVAGVAVTAVWLQALPGGVRASLCSRHFTTANSGPPCCPQTLRGGACPPSLGKEGLLDSFLAREARCCLSL